MRTDNNIPRVPDSSVDEGSGTPLKESSSDDSFEDFSIDEEKEQEKNREFLSQG